jgi:aspartate/methionine/tyrosine aminotransferase
VFTRDELERLAALVTSHNAYLLSDEVYEHLVFPGTPHVSPRTLPGMAERCIRLNSAGKTFSFTAWKVGGGVCVQPQPWPCLRHVRRGAAELLQPSAVFSTSQHRVDLDAGCAVLGGLHLCVSQ